MDMVSPGGVMSDSDKQQKLGSKRATFRGARNVVNDSVRS